MLYIIKNLIAPVMTNVSLVVLFLSGMATAQVQVKDVCATTRATAPACLTVSLIETNLTALGLPLPYGSPTGTSVLTEQLSSAAPLPSPASGFTYTFDPSSGVFLRSTTSYGPILSERADTVGAHRVFLGFSYQFLDFTQLDGIPLSNIPTENSFGPGAYATGNFDLHLRLNQFTLVGTYGLTDRLDLSVAVPIINSQIGGTYRQQTSFGPISRTISSTINRSATGIGDIQFQLKDELIRRERGGLALGVRFRAATGSAYDLLGAGAVGVQPFLAGSVSVRKWLVPHANVGYQWNARSILAGDVTTETKGRLAGSISYAAGAEFVLSSRVTAVADFIGQEIIHGDRAQVNSLDVLPGIRGIGFVHQSYNQSSASTGVKFSPGGKFLIVANLLFRVNHGGLTAPVIPLLGLSYVR